MGLIVVIFYWIIVVVFIVLVVVFVVGEYVVNRWVVCKEVKIVEGC